MSSAETEEEAEVLVLAVAIPVLLFALLIAGAYVVQHRFDWVKSRRVALIAEGGGK